MDLQLIHIFLLKDTLSSHSVMLVSGGEDRIALDAELQKEISIIWPYLPQKTLDLLVPINKGLAQAAENCAAEKRKKKRSRDLM